MSLIANAALSWEFVALVRQDLFLTAPAAIALFCSPSKEVSASAAIFLFVLLAVQQIHAWAA